MMKFATAKEHRDYFRKQRHVAFEGLLTEQQCMQLNSYIDDALSKRLGERHSSLSLLPAEKLFAQGRDLWRAGAKLKKIVLHRGFAQAAADLIEMRPLRIAYDQLLPSYSTAKFPVMSLTPPKADEYAAFLKRTATLSDISCVQGVACGLMLCVKAPAAGAAGGEEERFLSSVFPRFAGHGVFFAPDMPIDFSMLTAMPEARYLMIAYTQHSSVYCHQEGDPHVNYFRSLGYNFGDRLSEQLNPQVCA